jgi:hypothetical protein
MMNLKLASRSILTLIAFAAPSICLAETPWQKMVLFKRLEADPNKSYALTEQNGPWTIMAMTFRGEEAETHARALVHELRKVHKLAAYTYTKTYDYTGEVQGRAINGTPLKMRYLRDQQVDEVAVLVGDFDTVDDSRAQKILKQLKYMQPESLSLEKGKGTSQSYGTLRRLQQKVMGNDAEQKKGPMRHAMVTTNPLLPKEYFAPKGIDKLVLEMNKDVEHSLLNCPGKYTVRIATFDGYVVLDQKQIQKMESGELEPKSQLAKAAMRAHKLTEALRKQGVEAYEFHDRFESIVTVGSFDKVGTPRPDGKVEINPQIHAIMEQYRGQQSTAAARIRGAEGTGSAAGLQAKQIAGIPLDIQPLPVEVPRRSIASDYRQVNYEE